MASSFVGHPVLFHATTLGSKVSVKPEDAIPVRVGDRELLCLEVWYRCVFDHANRYLLVDESAIKVYGGKAMRGDPLFRYEYDRSSANDLPSAHLHVHAHRDHFVLAMALGGESGARRRQSLQSAGSLDSVKMADLHFPLGGHRFRPGFEDVLQMLHTEFGAVAGPTWLRVLKTTREAYRRSQTASVVRDCPSEAVRVLREMGYDVREPGSGPAVDRTDRLHAF